MEMEKDDINHWKIKHVNPYRISINIKIQLLVINLLKLLQKGVWGRSLVNNKSSFVLVLPGVPSHFDNNYSTQQLLKSLSSLLTYFTLLASTYTVVCSLNVTINLSTFQTTALLSYVHGLFPWLIICDSGYLIQQTQRFQQ